jgi:predicted metal-binding protein
MIRKDGGAKKEREIPPEKMKKKMNCQYKHLNLHKTCKEEGFYFTWKLNPVNCASICAHKMFPYLMQCN